jgi:hypothetical protein
MTALSRLPLELGPRLSQKENEAESQHVMETPILPKVGGPKSVGVFCMGRPALTVGKNRGSEQTMSQPTSEPERQINFRYGANQPAFGLTSPAAQIRGGSQGTPPYATLWSDYVRSMEGEVVGAES